MNAHPRPYLMFYGNLQHRTRQQDLMRRRVEYVKLRTKEGLTAKEIAIELGVTRQTVSNIKAEIRGTEALWDRVEKFLTGLLATEEVRDRVLRELQGNEVDAYFLGRALAITEKANG